ncbi:MAG: hypothetical protein H6765_04160 [Candidatus Peribacteria bacterium]|nr:MAG: hypothetical protein H6765_04160 [Candidatus Peribacteria bacterium]
MQAVAATLVDGGKTVMERMDTEKIVAGIQNGSDKPVPTLLLEKTLESEFNPAHDIFGTTMMVTQQENLLA